LSPDTAVFDQPRARIPLKRSGPRAVSQLDSGRKNRLVQ
jgi:hypothetical protein